MTTPAIYVGPAATAVANNTTLPAGAIGITNEGGIKIGPGSWNVLPYLANVQQVQALLDQLGGKADAEAVISALAAKLGKPTGGTPGQALVLQADGSYAPASIQGGSSTNTRVAAAPAIPLDSVAGKAMPLTAGQAIQITGTTAPTVGANPVDGGVCVVDYEVSGSLDLSAFIASGATVAPGYRYRITFEYSLLEGKAYAYVVQGSALAQAAPAAPTLAAGTATATTQPLTATPGAVDAGHGAALTYSFYKSTDGGQNFALMATQSGASYTATGLSEQTSYQYRATANNATGPSAVSNVVTASTPANASPVLEFYTVTANNDPVSPRDVSGGLDFYIDLLDHTGSGVTRYTRKAGANAITNAGVFGVATTQGTYGGAGETWTWTNGVDNGGTNYAGSSANTTGVQVDGATQGGYGWTLPAGTGGSRNGAVVNVENYSAGLVLHATDLAGGSPDIEMPLPVKKGTYGVRCRGTGNFRVEIRKPAGNVGMSGGFGVMGAELVGGV